MDTKNNLPQKSISFLGDSFTWGEGLELYCNSAKWISERSVDNSNWASDLKLKQDEDGTEFRNKNRYPALVGNELNCNFFVDHENGGSISRNLEVLEYHLIKYNITDVVLQFSSHAREPYHLTHNCRCDFCINFEYSPPLDNIRSYIQKKLNKEFNEITNYEIGIINFISEKIGVSDVNSLEFLEKSDEYLKNHFSKQINLINKGFFYRLKNHYDIKLHFIDSWCKETSNILEKNIDVYPFLIPLIGKDGKYYKKWPEWINTFKSKRILDDFPLTKNHHPSVEVHRYLAKSVVEYFLSQNKILYI